MHRDFFRSPWPLSAERDLKLLPFRVPAAEIPKFLEFLRAVEQETRKQHVFKKP